MSQVSVAFYIPHSWRTLQGITGHAIAWWTADVEDRFSHCEVVVNDPETGHRVCLSSSAMDGGWRAKPVGKGRGEIDLEQDHWVIVPQPHVSPVQVWSVFRSHEGMPYGYVDIVTKQVLNIPWGDARGDFCSVAAAKMLGKKWSRLNGISPNATYELLALER